MGSTSGPGATDIKPPSLGNPDVWSRLAYVARRVVRLHGDAVDNAAASVSTDDAARLSRASVDLAMTEAATAKAREAENTVLTRS